MTIGKLGIEGSHIRKKFRWTFNLMERIQSGTGHEIEVYHDPFFIKLQHRPFEDQELEFLNGKPRVDLSFIKDEEARKKLEKQVFVFTFIDDCPTNEKGEYTCSETIKQFYGFLADVYNLANCDENGRLKEEKLWGRWGCQLTLYDGCGNPLERWTMKEIHPLSINFGDLDYSDSSEIVIEATIMYKDVNYQSLTIKEGQAGYDANHKCLEERLKEVYRKLHK